MNIKIFNSPKKKLQIVFLISLLTTASACGSKYNTTDQKDPNAGSEYVYGNIDGPPLQANNNYPADADAAARANKIREKMFGDTEGSEPGLQEGNPGQ
jgi:hypothetical protein